MRRRAATVRATTASKRRGEAHVHRPTSRHPPRWPAPSPSCRDCVNNAPPPLAHNGPVEPSEIGRAPAWSHRLRQDLLVVLHRGDAWIGLVTVVGERALDDGIELIAPHTH